MSEEIIWQAKVTPSMVDGWSQESVIELTNALDKAVEAVFTTLEEANK